MADIPHTKMLVLHILARHGRMRYSFLRSEYQARLGIGGGEVADAGFASMIAEMIAQGLIAHSTEPAGDGPREQIAELWAL